MFSKCMVTSLIYNMISALNRCTTLECHSENFLLVQYHKWRYNLLFCSMNVILTDTTGTSLLKNIHTGGNDFNLPSSLLTSSQQAHVNVFTGKVRERCKCSSVVQMLLLVSDMLWKQTLAFPNGTTHLDWALIAPRIIKAKE